MLTARSIDVLSNDINSLNNFSIDDLHIVIIAKALKDKPEYAWRNALQELERPSSENLVGSVTAQTYSCIWLSYNHLETDELKSTFLLFRTMGFASDASVEVLLRYGMGLRLFKIAYTMGEA